jgi:hypothetical protein
VEVLATPPRQRCRREEDGGARPNGEAGVEVVAHMAAMSLVGFTGVTVATGVREGVQRAAEIWAVTQPICGVASYSYGSNSIYEVKMVCRSDLRL